MNPRQRRKYFETLSPGSNVDHRGTLFDAALLEALLEPLKDASTGRPTFGVARFEWATFSGKTDLYRSIFTDYALFEHATFEDAWFWDAEFKVRVSFDWATFDSAEFHGAIFSGASFRGTNFGRMGPDFRKATFGKDVSDFGPFTTEGVVDLSFATFQSELNMEASALSVWCRGTRWESMAVLKLRYAILGMDGAILSAPVAITYYPSKFTVTADKPLNESVLHSDPRPKILTLQSTDASSLVLTDVDLSRCGFIGAFNLDQLRIEGNCTFAETPQRRWLTRRRVLEEEHHWRALNSKNADPPAGWIRGPYHPNPELSPKPAQLAATYRQLRKGLEDAKNEPEAADFYYGEMEMRRHDSLRPKGERVLLTLYWAFSGYGLRATRGLVSLLLAMGLTTLLLMLVGLPANPRNPRTSGTVTVNRSIDVTTEDPGPGGVTPKEQSDRFSWDRAKEAGLTTINSVVFRSAGQDLTLAGTFIEMTSRVVEPILLGLTLLAVRGRVKR
ncbi:pentapeptide repeat-containing protein [Streptomyces sp. NPDC046939]|uniref:pentapeptide repeat-containing protein n=1 Tax=Streptomyces sp. NPDC046939 TaxID=3155376 RepID=UPI00340E3028